MKPSTDAHKFLQQLIRGDPINKKCCDCDTPNPRWASINIGCFLCLECSGIHRALGVHISKVRSTTLDKWQKSWVQHMSAVGNQKVNAFYEFHLPSNFVKPSNIKDKAEFIRDKYEGKKWYGEPGSGSTSYSNNNNNNAFGVSRQSAKPKRAAPENAAQRAKRRQQEREAKKAAAANAQHNATSESVVEETTFQQQQQQSQQQQTSEQKQPAPTSTLESFKASAAANAIPVVSPISSRRKSRGDKEFSDTRRETAADRARRRKLKEQVPTSNTKNSPPANQEGGSNDNMFNGLSGGNMFSGLSSTKERRNSRDSLERHLSKRRPSIELQRLNILKSDPTDASNNHILNQANNHIELQQTRQTLANTLERRPSEPSGFDFMSAKSTSTPSSTITSSSFNFIGGATTAVPSASGVGNSEVVRETASGFDFIGGGSGGESSSLTNNNSIKSESLTMPNNMMAAFDGLDNTRIISGGMANGMDSGMMGSSVGMNSGIINDMAGDTGGGGMNISDEQQTNEFLKEQEANLEILEQKCATIQTIVYQFEEMRTQFLNAKSELAQLNGNLERLQSQGIDAIVVQHLDAPAQDAIKAERKVLTQRVAYLFDQISVTADYMSNLTVS